MASTSSANLRRRTPAIRSSAATTSARGAKLAAALWNDGVNSSTPIRPASARASIPAMDAAMIRGFQVSG